MAELPRRPKCPKCKGIAIVPIVYGLPGSAKLISQIKRGEIVAGGCCVTGHDPKLALYGVPAQLAVTETSSRTPRISGENDIATIGYLPLRISFWIWLSAGISETVHSPRLS